MATVQTIATTLTADPKPFVQGIREFDREVGRAFTRLDQLNKRASSALGGGGIGGLGGAGGGNAARGLLELSRGAEDAAVSFGLNGVQGAIRGSLNNLTQFATMMGGPVAGAVAGFTAAGVSIAAPYISSLFEAGEEAARFAKQLDIATEKSRQLFESRAKNRESEIDFRNERQGLGTSENAESAISRRRLELEKNTARLRELEAAKERNFGATSAGNTLPLSAYGATNEEQEREIARRRRADELDSEFSRERLDLLRKERDLRIEIGQLGSDKLKLIEKERELQKQKDAEEFAGIIRKMQEEGQREAELEREREANRRKQNDDRIEGVLKGRLQGLGKKMDPLEGLDVPEAIRGRLKGLLGEIDSLDSSRGGGLAGVATANSQSLLRAQAQAKEAAEAKAQRDRLIQKVEELLKEFRAQRQAEEDADDVDMT